MSDSDLDARVAWQRHLGRGSAANRWYESVLDRYREPHRHYHDVRHVRWVVRHVGDLARERALDDVDAVIAAAFFHDVIYDPRAADNESASARLAASALDEIGWTTDRIVHVTRLVEGTAHHRSAETPLDAADPPLDQAVLDAADLAVLAADPGGYSDYVRNVRREYVHVADADWVAGRGAVLTEFLGRSAIYSPRLGLDAWERRARANLTAEIELLRR